MKIMRLKNQYLDVVNWMIFDQLAKDDHTEGDKDQGINRKQGSINFPTQFRQRCSPIQWISILWFPSGILRLRILRDEL